MNFGDIGGVFGGKGFDICQSVRSSQHFNGPSACRLLLAACSLLRSDQLGRSLGPAPGQGQGEGDGGEGRGEGPGRDRGRGEGRGRA